MSDLPAGLSLPRVDDPASQRANDKIRAAVNSIIRNMGAGVSATSTSASPPLIANYVPTGSLSAGQILAVSGGPVFRLYLPTAVTLTSINVTRLGSAITAGTVTAQLEVALTTVASPVVTIGTGDTIKQAKCSIKVPALTPISVIYVKSGSYAQSTGGLVFNVYGTA